VNILSARYMMCVSERDYKSASVYIL